MVFKNVPDSVFIGAGCIVAGALVLTLIYAAYCCYKDSRKR